MKKSIKEDMEELLESGKKLSKGKNKEKSKKFRRFLTRNFNKVELAELAMRQYRKMKELELIVKEKKVEKKFKEIFGDSIK